MEDVAIQLTRVSSRITNLDQKIEEIRLLLQQIEKPISVNEVNNKLTLSTTSPSSDNFHNFFTPIYKPEFLGDEDFKKTYGTRYALYAGSMANGISSEDLVIAMGRAGMMGSFGAGGLLPDRIEKAIQIIKSSLPNGPYIFNLINSPNEPALEEKTAELYIRLWYQCNRSISLPWIDCQPGLVPSIRIK